MVKSVDDKEILLMNDFVDDAMNLNKKKMVNKSDSTNIYSITIDFIKKERVCVYGGTAINNILPKKDQFYDSNINLPDYDFFSSEAMVMAKKLAKEYFNKGYTNVEAKSGVYKNTYKIFVNYIPVADITQMDSKLFNEIMKDAIVKNDINYAPANFLRMLLYYSD